VWKGAQVRLNASLAPLRHRPFAMFWTGAFVSNIGTWMETVAVGILVTEATDQAGWAGLVAAAGFAPSALLGPFGGAIADRFSRKRILLITTAAQTLLAALLFVLALRGDPEPAIVVLIVLGTGCANALGFPSYQSILPDLVPPDELVAAVGLSSAQWNLGRVVGPALAGIVITAGGERWGFALAFAVNTISFLAVILVVAALRLPGPRLAAHTTSIIRSIGHGFAFAWEERGLRTIVIYMAFNSLLAAPFIALIPPMAIKVLDAGDAGTSALVAAQGVGAVTMALLLGTLAKRYGSRGLLAAAIWLLPFALIAYSLSPGIVAAVVFIFFVGALYLGTLSSFTSVAQLRAPTELRGRVMSVLMVLLGSLYPIGSIVQGWLSDEIGQRVTQMAAAVAMLVVLAILRVVFPHYLRALDDDVTTVESTAPAVAR
jgi:MFS family permease